MAGIGFELNKLSLKEGVFAPFTALGHGAVIAAGPWIFTILAIGTISLTSVKHLGPNALAEFRVIIIYAFALSLLLTSPVVIIATRMVSDAIYTRKFHAVSAIFFAACALAAMVSLFFTLVLYGLVLSLPLPALVAGTATCLIVSMIWVAHAFCSAVRDFSGVTLGFVSGLFVALAGASIASINQWGAIGLIWTFNIGLMVIFASLASRVLLTFPNAVGSPRKALALFAYASSHYWLMGLASLVSVTAIWIDKWIMWVGPIGERLPIGLLHAPLYDSAMFVAYLVIIPSLSLFIVDLETTFFIRYQRYFSDIQEHATLQQIRDNADSLKQEVARSLRRIFIVQASLCAILILISPLIIEAMNMQYRQIAIFRFGVLGALFQFIFMAASSLLLFFNRTSRFLALQTLFLVLNAILTYASVVLGEAYYGYGYMISCLVSAVASILALEKSLVELNFTTFVSAAATNRDGKWLQRL